MKSNWSVLYRDGPLPSALPIVIASGKPYHEALAEMKKHKKWRVGLYRRLGPKQTGIPHNVTFWIKEPMKSYPVFEIRVNV